MKIIQSPSGGHMMADGREIINFGGTCYLGITSKRDLIESAKRALDEIGAMGQIPKHYGYTTQWKIDVENAAIDFFETEDAVYFSAGYLFASMALQGLKDDYDVIFMDRSAHYSVRDGAMATGKPIYEFDYCNANDLRRVIKAHLKDGEIPCLATDGMFPTYGNLSPLGDYYEIINCHNGWMIVDESHSLGIIGDTGKGVCEKFGLKGDRVIAGGSMAKAFCAYGGIAFGSRYAMNKLRQSPPARGAASGMSAAAAMTAASLKYVKSHPKLLKDARKRIQLLKKALNGLNLNVGTTESPVATFELDSAVKMKELQKHLESQGIFVQYSTYVGAGPEGVIRLASYPDHTDEDLGRLVHLIKDFLGD